MFLTHYYISALARARSRSRISRRAHAAVLCLSTPRRPRLAAASTPAPPPPRSAAPAPPPARPRTHRAAPRAAAPTPGRQSCTTTSPPARGASRGRTTRRRWTSVERCAIGESIASSCNAASSRSRDRIGGRATSCAWRCDATNVLHITPHRTHDPRRRAVASASRAHVRLLSHPAKAGSLSSASNTQNTHTHTHTTIQ